MAEPPVKRSAIQRAAFWTGRVTNAGLQMVIPGLIGHWIDRQLGTQVLFTMVGFAGGMVLAIRGLIGLSHSLNERMQEEGSRDSKQ